MSTSAWTIWESHNFYPSEKAATACWGSLCRDGSTVPAQLATTIFARQLAGEQQFRTIPERFLFGAHSKHKRYVPNPKPQTQARSLNTKAKHTKPSTLQTLHKPKTSEEAVLAKGVAQAVAPPLRLLHPPVRCARSKTGSIYRGRSN